MTIGHCPTCRQEIEASKLRLHESRCARHNYYCEVCQIPVLKEEREEHEQEFHAVEKCPHCPFEGDKQSLKVHVDQLCENLPQTCNFCEQLLAKPEFSEHIAMCGSRTEKCSECGEWVRKADKMEHYSLCDTIRISKQKEEQAKNEAYLEDFRKQMEKDIEKEKAAKQNPGLAAYRRRMDYKPSQPGEIRKGDSQFAECLYDAFDAQPTRMATNFRPVQETSHELNQQKPEEEQQWPNDGDMEWPEDDAGDEWPDAVDEDQPMTSEEQQPSLNKTPAQQQPSQTEFSGGMAGMSEEEQMIAKAIEESLRMTVQN